MPFSNCNSGTVKGTGSGKCHIELAMTGGWEKVMVDIFQHN